MKATYLFSQSPLQLGRAHDLGSANQTLLPQTLNPEVGNIKGQELCKIYCGGRWVGTFHFKRQQCQGFSQEWQSHSWVHTQCPWSWLCELCLTTAMVLVPNLFFSMILGVIPGSTPLSWSWTSGNFSNYLIFFCFNQYYCLLIVAKNCMAIGHLLMAAHLGSSWHWNPGLQSSLALFIQMFPSEAKWSKDPQNDMNHRDGSVASCYRRPRDFVTGNVNEGVF